MPCLAMHLAVAEEYLKKHIEEDRENFILGTIAVDINTIDIRKKINCEGEDKNSRHFGTIDDTTKDPIEYMKKKVNLQKFIAENHIDTSFRRAYFLHLICDRLFYDKLITNETIKEISAEKFREKIIRDYNRITPILISKFHLEIPDIINNIISGHSDGNLELFSEEYAYHFIKDASRLDLNKFKRKILNDKKDRRI